MTPTTDAERRGSEPAFPTVVHEYRRRDDLGGMFVLESSTGHAGISKREAFAMAAITWTPTDDEVNREMGFDKARNPYNEPYKPPVRGRSEIIAQLQVRRAEELLAALNQEPRT